MRIRRSALLGLKPILRATDKPGWRIIEIDGLDIAVVRVDYANMLMSSPILLEFLSGFLRRDNAPATIAVKRCLERIGIEIEMDTLE